MSTEPRPKLTLHTRADLAAEEALDELERFLREHQAGECKKLEGVLVIGFHATGICFAHHGVSLERELGALEILKRMLIDELDL